LGFTPCFPNGPRLRGTDAWFTTFHSQREWVTLVGRGACLCWDPFFACSGWGPRGYIRGEVCGAGPDPLRPPNKHSAPTVLCRARRGVPGHASCVLAVPVFSSGVPTRDYRAHGMVASRAGGGRALLPHLVEQRAKEDTLSLLRGAHRGRSSRPSSPNDFFPRVATPQRQVGEPQLGSRWTGVGVGTPPGAPE